MSKTALGPIPNKSLSTVLEINIFTEVFLFAGWVNGDAQAVVIMF